MVTRDFFIISNAVHGITDADYKLADLLVNAAKAFARSTHQGVYIIDYFKMNFLYVSENLANWCGVPADKIREFGYQIYVDHVPEEEQKMLIEINRSGFNLFETIPVEERLDYTISYDFHFITGRKKQLINHNLTPMTLTKDGRIWLALCTVAMSSRSTPGHIVMRKSDSGEHTTSTHSTNTNGL